MASGKPEFPQFPSQFELNAAPISAKADSESSTALWSIREMGNSKGD